MRSDKKRSDKRRFRGNNRGFSKPAAVPFTVDKSTDPNTPLQAVLNDGRDYSVKKGHPWIFSGAIKLIKGNLTAGAPIKVFGSTGEFVAAGHYSGEGSISIKVLTLEDEPLDQAFFAKRFQTAFALRKALELTDSGSTTAYRLINAEGDFLPGLIVDIYNTTAVVQCQSPGMKLERDNISAALRHVYGKKLTAVCDRTAEETSESEEGEEKEQDGSYLFGGKGESVVKENGISFDVDWEKGQKTGFFLDQRINRQLVRDHSTGKKVLNAFCYTGGFSLYALAGKANFVRSIDSSRSATSILDRNVELNFPSAAHESVTADYLAYLQSSKELYDLIVLDPPAFAKHKAAVERALKGYATINLNGINSLNPGGLLFTFSCSQLVSRDAFLQMLRETAHRSGKSIQVIQELHQAPCHPVNLQHSEGSYLKGFVLRVV